MSQSPPFQSFYLNWCPVNAIPVHNRIQGCGFFVRGDENNPPTIAILFDVYQQLISIDYVIRLDGIFILRLVVREKPPYVDTFHAPRDVSNYIKNAHGHVHEFHEFPGYYLKSRKTPKRYLARVWQTCWDKLIVGTQQVHADFDYDLHVDPIEIEDPFSQEFAASTSMTFTTLEQTIMPGRQDSPGGDIAENVSMLRCCRHDSTSRESDKPRALLRLRKQFALRKDRCLLAYDRKKTNKWSNGVCRPFGYGAILFLLIAAVLYFPSRVRFDLTLAIASISFFVALVLVDYRLQAPRLELIQRTIGFYTCVNTFSRLVETVFSGLGAGREFNTTTGNFDNTIKGLEARYVIEKQIIDNRKYVWAMLFAFLTTVLAIVKILASH